MAIITKCFMQLILPFVSGAIACWLQYLHVLKDDCFTGFSRVKRDGKTYYSLGYWKALITGGFVGVIGVHLILPIEAFTFSKVLITSALTGISGISFLVQNAMMKHKDSAAKSEAKAKIVSELNAALLQPIEEPTKETEQSQDG